MMGKLYFNSQNNDFTLYQGDCLEVLQNLDAKFKTIFADPPYFLSNGGISVHAGKMVSVNKGDWDKSKGFDADNEFNYKWLSACRERLADSGTIWVSGTFHNIFSVAQAMTEIGYKILNCVTWEKTNPPPNLSCRYFTHSTEFVLWARKSEKSKHYYNYDLMRRINGGTQMKDVWRFPAIAPWEKSCGKHPTQKPLSLLTRIVLASTEKGDLVLDPFSGSATTGIACALTGRRYIGIEKESDFLEISKNRFAEIQNKTTANSYRSKIADLKNENQKDLFGENGIQYKMSVG